MRFYYNEINDDDAFLDYLTHQDVIDLIQEHNEYFGTNYKTIAEFNDGEPHREIGVMSKAEIAYAYLSEHGYDCKRIGDWVWVTIWTHDLEDAMQVMVDLDDPKFNEAYN